jgi:hypothetical protein
VEAQKLKALGIRNRIEAEIGAPPPPPLPRAPATRCTHVAPAESRKQKVSEVKQQIAEEEEEVQLLLLHPRCFLTCTQAQRLMAELHALQQVLLLLLLLLLDITIPTG